MGTLDQMFGIRTIGRFIHNHFKFVFCVVWFTYLIFSVFESIHTNREFINTEIHYEIKKALLDQFHEMNKKFKELEVSNSERENRMGKLNAEYAKIICAHITEKSDKEIDNENVLIKRAVDFLELKIIENK